MVGEPLEIMSLPEVGGRVVRYERWRDDISRIGRRLRPWWRRREGLGVVDLGFEDGLKGWEGEPGRREDVSSALAVQEQS
jgi:hypothetical protein